MGCGVLPVAALGRGLAVASAVLGLATAGGAERPPLGATRRRSTGSLVSGALVPWVGGSGDGLPVMIVWLGAGAAALAPGFSSMPTSRDAVPTACPTALPLWRRSPEAPIAGGGVAGDSGDMPAAISWGMLDGDTPRAIPVVALFSRRGGVPACDVTGTLAALGTPGVPGTATPVPGAALGDHVSAPGAAPCWSPVWSGGAGAGPRVTPVAGGAEPTMGPGWLWLGDASDTAGVAPVSHSIVVALSLASDAVPIPASLIGVLLTREDGWAAGPVPMPYTPREDVGAAAARGAPSGFALPPLVRDKDVATLGLAGGDPPAATSAVVAPGPAEGVWGSRDPTEYAKGPREGPPGPLGAALGDSLMLSPTELALVSGEAVPAVALVLGSLLMDTSSAPVLPRAGNDRVGTCSAAVTSIAIAGVPGASVVVWGWVTALAPGSPSPAVPGAVLRLKRSVSPAPGTAPAGSWGVRSGGI